MSGRGAAEVAIGLLVPELLGTYGDSGNAAILARRLAWRGIPARVVTVEAGKPFPSMCEIYVIGGGEDIPQALATKELGPDSGRPLQRAVESGAAVLAVCAGVQILGRSFVGPDGSEVEGLGILDCRTTRGQGARAVGEMVVAPSEDLGLPELTGYENHAGVTRLGPTARPLGRVLSGVGNGGGSGYDGVTAGRVLGTYMHGPVLARNPLLADLLLSWVVGPLSPVDDTEMEDLREERLTSVRSAPGGYAHRARYFVRQRVTASRRVAASKRVADQ
jgi:lipid II isoglutaminyl synthase (glutamine-hydrolysing)